MERLNDVGRYVRNGLRYLCICIAFVALFVILIEISLRIWQPLQLRVRGSRIELAKNETTQNVYTFNTDKIRSPVVIRNNSLGFRGPEPPQNFSEYQSVITVGGSTTACGLLSEGYTWQDYLHAGLSEQINNFWINNAGLNGHSTFGHIKLLQEYISKIKPTYILILVGVNDMAIEQETSWDQMQIISSPDTKKSILTRMVDQSMIAAYVQYARSKKGKYIVMAEKDYSVDIRVLGTSTTYAQFTQEDALRYDSAISAYEDRLRLLLNIARRSSIKPILVTQPALYGFGIDDVTGVDLGEMLVSDFTEDGVTRKGRDKWLILQMYNAATKRIGDEFGIPVIDLANEMPKSTRHYTDYIHFSEAGAQKVASILLPELAAIFHRGY